MTHTYDEHSTDELRDDAVDTIKELRPTARPDDDSTLVHALVESLAETLDNQESSLTALNNASYIVHAEGEVLTEIANNRYGIDRKDPQKATGVLKFSRDSPPSSPITIQKGTIAETVSSDPVQFETDEDVTMGTSETSVTVNATAVEGGTQANVGTNTVEALPSPPEGSLEVTNPDPMGDPSTTLTGGSEAQRGLDEETDAELRQRALDTTAFGGAASTGAIQTAINDIDDVISVSANVNATSTDNSGSGGLPPYSSEYIVYGGQTSSIVEKMADLMTIIDFMRTEGGVSGTKDTHDVYSDALEQYVTGEITRPTKVDIDIDVDIVITDDYAGDDAVKSAIVDYIGGWDIDNSRVTALGISEDVVINKLESTITDVNGVRGLSDLVVDKDGDGTDDRTTNANGLEVIAIGNTEVAITNGADGSITVTTTQA